MIQITADLLRAKSGELRDMRAEHDEVMNRMRNLILNLNEVWKGDAQTALVERYEGMQSTFTNFSELLESYAMLMDKAAAAFENAEQQNTSYISGFGG